MNIEKETKKFLKINSIVEQICQRHKSCDRQVIFHTLQCLKQPIMKRLEMSIRRAHLSLYAKRDKFFQGA